MIGRELFSRKLKEIFAPLSIREKFVYGLLIFAVISAIYGPVTRATTANQGSLFSIPVQQCKSSEGWYGFEQVSGQPSIALNQDLSLFSSTNSAVTSEDAGSLVCAGFNDQPEHLKVKSALGLSLATLKAGGKTLTTDTSQTEQIILNEASTSNQIITERSDLLIPNIYAQESNLSLDGLLMVSLSSDQGTTWQPFHMIETDLFQSTQPHVYIAIPDEFLVEVDQLAIRLESVLQTENTTKVLVDSIFLTYEVGAPQEVELELVDDSGAEITEKLPVLEGDSSIELELSAKDPDHGFWQGFGSNVADIFSSDSEPSITARGKIIDQAGEVISNQNLELDYQGHDLSSKDYWNLEIDMPQSSDPGRYTLEVTIFDKESGPQTTEQDFLWGVLAMNTDQAQYTLNQEADIAITTLDDLGRTVCDATIVLEVTGPSSSKIYSTADDSIELSPTCDVYGPIPQPDYSTNHTFTELGEYIFELTSTTENGSYTISDAVSVVENSEFVIKRSGPTRLYPPIIYSMDIEITPDKNFKGQFQDFVPASFDIFSDGSQNSFSEERVGDLKVLTWDINLAANQTQVLNYSFKAPDISPEFYLIGPGTLNVNNEMQFQEGRQWQLAGDAVGDIAIYRDSNGTFDTNVTSFTGVPFNTIQTEGTPYTQNANDIDVDLADAGHYLFGYIVQASGTDGNRQSVRTRVTLAGSEQSVGQGAGYRRNTNNTRYYSYGYGIVEASAGDDLRVEVLRVGTNSAAMTLEADRSSLWILKLDDAWDYARLQGADNQSTTVALQNIDFTTQNELDTGSFTHSTATNPEQITLDTAGHYLVTYNVGADGSTNRTSISSNLTLNNNPVEHSYDYGYIRGSSGTTESTTANMTIIEASANDILRVQWGATGAVSANGSSTVAGRTGLTIVKLPDSAEYLRVHETGGGQNIGGSGTNIVIHDTEDEEDTGSFTHNNTTGVTTINDTSDYLFTAGARTNRGTTGNTRMTTGGAWFVNSTRQTVGNTGTYVRGDQGSNDTFDGGWSAAGLFSLTATDTIDFREIDEGDNGNSDTFQADSYGITAVNLDTLTSTANTAPDSPTSLDQIRVTAATSMAVGDWTNETQVKFEATATDTDNPDTLELCVEVDPLGTAFSNTEDACGTGVSYSGTAVTVDVTITGLTDATEYHWQARIKDAAGDYSSWVSFGGNAESARDFGIDTTAPTGGTVYDGTTTDVDADFNDGSLSSLSANWSGISVAVSGLSLYEYSIGTSPGATDIVNWTSNGTTANVTATGLSLNTSTEYFFNVRITDNANNQSTISSDGQFVSPTLTFSTSNTSIDFGNLNSTNSYTATATTTTTTSTNAYNGYVIRAFSEGLLTSQNSDTIGMFSGGTYASPDQWLGGDTGYGYTSSDTTIQGVDKFNDNPCPGGGTPPCYAPWSLIGPGDIVADHTDLVTGTPISNEQFTISHRVTTAATQNAGDYQTEIVYTITAIY